MGNHTSWLTHSDHSPMTTDLQITTRHTDTKSSVPQSTRTRQIDTARTMMGDGPPKAGKKSWHGQRDRMARLESAGIVIPAEIGDAGQAGPDDVLDAAAAAWSAHRIATHVACSVPDPPQSNERGQRMAIWY
jgi:hypothetical protein